MLLLFFRVKIFCLLKFHYKKFRLFNSNFFRYRWNSLPCKINSNEFEDFIKQKKIDILFLFKNRFSIRNQLSKSTNSISISNLPVLLGTGKHYVYPLDGFQRVKGCILLQLNIIKVRYLILFSSILCLFQCEKNFIAVNLKTDAILNFFVGNHGWQVSIWYYA